MTAPYSVSNTNTNKCPHGFPVGTCPMCAGMTGGAPKDRNKPRKAGKAFARPIEYLSGQSGKINFYGYFDQERGLLYNWILHPDNPVNKYMFLGFCAITSLGYIAKKATEAIRKVVVNQENKKSELNLEKKLVAVEIENFKAKKESAINPLIENFKLQSQNGKTEKELKEMAQNILTEIKTGPPYVYS